MPPSLVSPRIATVLYLLRGALFSVLRTVVIVNICFGKSVMFFKRPMSTDKKK